MLGVQRARHRSDHGAGVLGWSTVQHMDDVEMAFGFEEVELKHNGVAFQWSTISNRVLPSTGSSY